MMKQRWLRGLVMMTSLGVLLAAAAAAQPVGHGLTFVDEADFLRQAGPEWQWVAPSVWQKQEADGSTLEVGFGEASRQYAVARALENRDGTRKELASMDPYGPAYFKKRELLLTYEAEIDFLQHAKSDAETSFIDKATTTQSGVACSGGYSLEASASAGLRRGSGSAEATFSAPGPFSPYTKKLYASSVSSSSGGTDSDWQSSTFTSGCCYSVSAASATRGGGCTVNSVAYFQVTNGCNAFRSISQSAECFEPNEP